VHALISTCNLGDKDSQPYSSKTLSINVEFPFEDKLGTHSYGCVLLSSEVVEFLS